MTIIYQYRVATTSLGGFLKLLRAWKGSVYKLLFKELVIFLLVYTSISLVYRFGLGNERKRQFESLVLELNSATSAIPLSFVLGFYVTVIVQRWWQQFSNVPWPDRTLFIMCTYLQGMDDKARMMRRSVARYLMFGLILITRAVSVAVMKRFPTLDHIVEAGLISQDEAVLYEGTQCHYIKFWVPLMWANNVLATARREGRIQTDYGLRMVIEQLADFRDKCSLCFVYDWITVPLVYTQVVTCAVYTYFGLSILTGQYLDPSQDYDGFRTDYYIPGVTILQFLFYMGWLKVAEQMINPFGEDDDDFDINWLLDRHIAVSFALVDQCCGVHPALVKDAFWNDVEPDMPYTESSLASVRPNFEGSTFNVARPSIDVERMVLLDHEELAWQQRHRGKSSLSGSVLSLFPFRHLRHLTDSRDTLTSNGSGRHLSVPNGKLRYKPLSRDDEGTPSRRSSLGVMPVTKFGLWFDEEEEGLAAQLRERASTDADSRIVKDRERKLSLPKSMQFSDSLKRDVVSASPKLSRRFTVEPVIESQPPGDGQDSSHSGKSAKTRRTGNTHLLAYQGTDRVSRVPELSAIEEGNTVTSLRQLLESSDTHYDTNSLGSYDDVFAVIDDDKKGETGDKSSQEVQTVQSDTIKEENSVKNNKVSNETEAAKGASENQSYDLAASSNQQVGFTISDTTGRRKGYLGPIPEIVVEEV